MDTVMLFGIAFAIIGVMAGLEHLHNNRKANQRDRDAHRRWMNQPLSDRRPWSDTEKR